MNESGARLEKPRTRYFLLLILVNLMWAFQYTGAKIATQKLGPITWIRREFHCFPSKVAENPPFVSKMLHQSLDFHKRSFNPPGVLIYEPDAISPAPTFG
jgi:hypothetical protein